eukprot:c11734_g1_i2.p1 GENE.c11734_g1_i2~~c11734_g1_i2.p1  ORF type:complete len:199 (-),score=56.91 c11734_g1_i2:129-725(-)
MMKSYKVVILGEGRVGKTSLLLRFVHNTFSDKQQSTIQASYLDKKITVGQYTANLAIWDTAGQERFHALGPIYYRDADAALLVFDITDTDSFTKVQKWVKELQKIVGPDILLCIAGNKCDMLNKRLVTVEQAQEYSQQVGATYFETSAKLNRGVQEVFEHLAKKLIEVKPPVSRASRRNNIQIIEDSNTAANSKNCSC